MEALFYETLKNKKVKCCLCPHECIIADGKLGICGVRENNNGKLIAAAYGKVSALNVDPIEKKPLYHFFPGKQILSVGGYGCNLACTYCQNCSISQVKNPHVLKEEITDINLLVKRAMTIVDNIGIAYTYNEPGIWFEYMLDIAKEAVHHNLKNVMVTNGYLNKEPLAEILPYMDAFNVDLKGFTPVFFKKYTKSTMEPVLNMLKTVKKSGKHLEITHLVITNLNDHPGDFKAMIHWLGDNLGKDVPLHISRYFPNYNLTEKATDVDTLEKFYHIAKKRLDYVYLGNVQLPGTENTICPKCGTLLIDRRGYQTNLVELTIDCKCSQCLEEIPVVLSR